MVALYLLNKLDYFRVVQEEHPTQIVNAKDKVTKLQKSKWSVALDDYILIYLACYKPKRAVLTALTYGLVSYSKDPNRFTQWKASKQHTTSMTTNNTNKLERFFLSKPVANIQNPLKWWLESTQQHAYPNLARMAVDLLLIPAMAADPEQLFLSTGYMINNCQNCLNINTIQALKCLKSWY